LYCPQFLVKSQLHFFKRYTTKFLAKARAIATHSAFSKTAIAEQYKIDGQSIHVIPKTVAGIFQPIDRKEKEKIKEKYAEGKEYFLFTGNLVSRNNLLNLLKAFSFFKKRQKSNMLLLMAGDQAGNDEAFITGLKTFKFRDEVKLLGPLSQKELAGVTAAAYAFVYPVLFEDFALRALEAMQCEVPVITTDAAAFTQLCADAALYANPHDFNDIADKMMTLFKDEQKRKQLIDAGKQRVREFDHGNRSDLMWQLISAVIK